MSNDERRLGHGEAAPSADPDREEVERHVAKFRAALELVRSDPAEAARIDTLVAELDADELGDAEDSFPFYVVSGRSRGRSTRPRDGELLVSAMPALPLLEKEAYLIRGKWPGLKKKTQKSVTLCNVETEHSGVSLIFAAWLW